MKRKQITVLGLVLVIIAVGILQYNYGDTGESYSESTYGKLPITDALGSNNEDIPGAAVYVNNGADASSVNEDQIDQLVQASGYFAEARMERNKARSRQKDELKAIVEGVNETVEASSNISAVEAQEQLLDIIRRSEVETTIETLIKQRGFEDALAYMSDTGNVDVIVKADSLTAIEVANISDIVVRHANVEMENITVKNVN
ncbi:MAG: SpoIIIAH-like family protein [Clostridiaceae bacterium]|nr:SpoIIIAH-like family protein [Clostridiaceae bacterium]